jgi:hypothetical protein
MDGLKKAPAEPVGFHGAAVRWNVIHEVLDRLKKASDAARRAGAPKVAGLINGIYRYLDVAHGNATYVHDVRNPTKPVPRGEVDDEAFAEKLLSDFDAQPPQITDEQLDEINASFVGLDRRRTRHIALASLARSGAQLIKAVTDDREAAFAMAIAECSIEKYVADLRQFADLMASAGTRIAVALCTRDDMQDLRATANAEYLSQGAPLH